MSVRLRLFVIGFALAVLAAHLFFAQPTVTLPSERRPPRVTLSVPGPASSQGGGVKISPGPDPWYTVMTTGDVVGYIEPCG